MRTYSPKASEIQHEWHVVNADGLVLGRMCTEIARVLRGKHKPIFAPHLDTGDHVVIVNAKKVVLTAGKADRERVYRHSGYPGGIKSETYGELLARKPEDAIRRTVKGMLPEGPARPPDAHQAEGVRRSRPPARGAVARAARPVRGPRPLIPEAPTAMATPLTQTTGRRKEAIARARLRPGTGVITVNGRPFETYFTTPAHRMEASEPLRVAEATERFDVDATITGGGVSGQAGALRMALARSLAELEPETRGTLKKAGLLTRDARKKESKKYGLKKARKAPQYTKR